MLSDLKIDPLRQATGAIERVAPLGDDALQPEPAGMLENEQAVVVVLGRPIEGERFCETESTDISDPLLSLYLGCCRRLRRKLEHRCFLAFNQVS